MLPPPPTSTLFPYTRSSDLSSGGRQPGLSNQGTPWLEPSFPARPHGLAHRIRRDRRNHGPRGPQRHLGLDRKSTRLNSSHVSISYAVFCLKKKKKEQTYY